MPVVGGGTVTRIAGTLKEDFQTIPATVPPPVSDEVAELRARCAAQAKALAVILAKANEQMSAYYSPHPGAKLVEIFVPLTPGELAIIERAVKG